MLPTKELVTTLRNLMTSKKGFFIAIAIVIIVVAVLAALFAPQNSKVPNIVSSQPQRFSDTQPEQAVDANIVGLDSPAPTMDDEEWRFLEIINNHRQTLGRQLLKPSVKLTIAAEWMSLDTKQRGFLPGDHSDSLGRSAQQRLQFFGYPYAGGENIAWVGASAQNAFNAWLSSPGHKANMERAEFRAIGIARVGASSNSYVWTTDFGDVVDAEIQRQTTTPTPTLSVTPTPSGSPTPTVTSTPTINPSTTPGVEVPTLTPTHTPTPSPTGQAVLTPSPTGQAMLTPSPTGQTPTPTTTPTPSTEPTILYISLKLPGIGKGPGDNSNPVHKERDVVVKTYNSKNELVTTITGKAVYSENNGKYNLTIQYGTIAAGIYYHTIKVNNSLVKRIPGVVEYSPTVSKNYPVINITLISGDLDQDNALTIKDYNLSIACFQEKPTCTSSIKSLADINDDGKTAVHADDFAILQRGFAIREGD